MSPVTAGQNDKSSPSPPGLDGSTTRAICSRRHPAVCRTITLAHSGVFNLSWCRPSGRPSDMRAQFFYRRSIHRLQTRVKATSGPRSFINFARPTPRCRQAMRGRTNGRRSDSYSIHTVPTVTYGWLAVPFTKSPVVARVLAYSD